MPSDDVRRELAPDDAEPSAEEIQDDVPPEVLRETPKGAAALAGVALGTLMLAWLAIYVFVFLPRGMVG